MRRSGIKPQLKFVPQIQTENWTEWCSTWAVPRVAALPPRHVLGKRGKEVEKAVGLQHVVVDGGDERNTEHRPPNTCKTKDNALEWSQKPL